MARMDNIVPLDQMDDFKVADHDPDVRGWEVVGLDGRKVGEVDRLLVDTAAMKVRYLDVDVADRSAGRDHHILIPIGYARLHEDREQVLVDRLSSTALTALPPYTHQTLTREYEADLRNRFVGTEAAAPAATTGPEFYKHESYDDDRFYESRRNAAGGERVTLSEEQLSVGKRETRAGAVEIDKEVETRHVRENVPLKHEEVVVERHAAPPGAATNAKIGADEVRVPINKEELVVDKRTVPKEELVVRKREVVENETVEADLKRERAEVHGEGDVKLREDRR